MTTNQPIWKHTASTGDVDPIAYGGGFVYTDETGVYAPEMVYFEPASDEQWHETEGDTLLTVYRFTLENEPESEWWYEQLADVAATVGQPLETLQSMSRGSLQERALLYESLIGYFGAFELDQYPLAMTEDEAYTKYADEMRKR